MVWNQHSLKPLEVLNSAFSVLTQWRNVQDQTFDHFLGYKTQEDSAEHWCLPPVNSVKVNSDATIFEETNCFSHAFFVHDHEARLVEARSKYKRESPSPELAEEVGIREVLSWDKDAVHTQVMIESNCLAIVRAIQSSFLCYSYLGEVINKCRRLFTSLNIKFSFAKQSAKEVAHYLARYSCPVADRIWTVGDVHSNFKVVLSNDLIC